VELVDALVAGSFLGKPLWMWLAFLAIVLGLLALDLGVFHRKEHEIGIAEGLLLSSFYIAIAVAFGAWVWWFFGLEPAIRYLTGFLIEKSLSMDNVFVIAMIFSYLSIPRRYQHRVLFWGILGVIVLRATLIGGGAALIREFSWVLYLFGAFLVLTGVRMLSMADGAINIKKRNILRYLHNWFRITNTLHGRTFFVKIENLHKHRSILYVTPLFVALVLIEIADIIFAFDSVPAIFAITQDPYIVYTSNVFAILGLRALYFALAAAIHRFRYLKYALALLLMFIGGKIFFVGIFGPIPAAVSLAATFAFLAGGILFSLWKTQHTPGRVGTRAVAE
jgi:tellurite resistance protein TerC